MPPIRRVGRPGLIGTMARTAAVVGTANAVNRGMNRRAQQREDQQAAADAYTEQQAYAQQQALAQQQAQLAAQQQAQLAAQQQAQPAPPAPSSQGDLMAQLTQLGRMKDSGLLTDAEFTAAKAKLLG